MPGRDSYDLVIVGGGMVGLSLACALADSRFSILVLDRSSPPEVSEINPPRSSGSDLASGYSPRVSAISSRSCRFLEEIGVWEKLPESRICQYSNMVVWDGCGTAEIDFSNESDRPQGCIIENQVLLAALFERATRANNIELGFSSGFQEILAATNATVSADTVSEKKSRIRLDSGEVVAANLIVGADGAESAVARYLGIRKKIWSYNQQAIVTTVETEKTHEFTAWQCFTDLGPLAFLPLNAKDPRYSSIVWSIDPGNARQLMNMNSGEFVSLLTRKFEKRLGRVLSVDRRHSYPLVQRHAVTYAKHSVVLVGDAAHTIHPLAGQGVNLGFADTYALAAALNKAEWQPDEPYPHYSKAIRNWERRRKSENLAMMALMESFRHLYGTRNPLVNWARNTGMKLFQSLPAFKKVILKVAGGI